MSSDRSEIEMPPNLEDESPSVSSDKREMEIPANHEAWAQQWKQRRRCRRINKPETTVSHTVTLIGNSIPRDVNTDYITRKTSTKLEHT